MVKKSGLDGSFLVDFDWSGKNQESVYLSFVNKTDVKRLDGSRTLISLCIRRIVVVLDDGESILALHDIEMLSYF